MHLQRLTLSFFFSITYLFSFLFFFSHLQYYYKQSITTYTGNHINLKLIRSDQIRSEKILIINNPLEIIKSRRKAPHVLQPGLLT